MARPLNEVELFFIKENANLSVEELVQKFPETDPNEVRAFLSYLRQSTTQAKTEDIDSADKFITGNLMAKRPGVTIMTPPASELADARRVHTVPTQVDYAKKNEGMIHTIKK